MAASLDTVPPLSKFQQPSFALRPTLGGLWLTRGRDDRVDYFTQPRNPELPTGQPDSFGASRHSHLRAVQTASQASTMIDQPEGVSDTKMYLPMGHSYYAARVGKYYPTNYENRNRRVKNNATPPPRSTLNNPAISEPRVSQIRKETSNAPSHSDLERRKRQYQLDMASQAAAAARALLENGSSPSHGSTASPRAAANLGRLKLPSNFKLDRHISSAHRPAPPRLAPLGSPGGPVTPMNLEDTDECLWSMDRYTPGSSAGYQASVRV